jgi:hypothetical protein
VAAHARQLIARANETVKRRYAGSLTRKANKPGSDKRWNTRELADARERKEGIERNTGETVAIINTS